MTTALDHGFLNVPLAKRGNIDAEIDRWKAGQAREAKAQRRAIRAAVKADKVKAVEMVEALTDERLNALAVHCKQTPAAVLKHLRSQCNWNPAFVIRLLAIPA